MRRGAGEPRPAPRHRLTPGGQDGSLATCRASVPGGMSGERMLMSRAVAVWSRTCTTCSVAITSLIELAPVGQPLGAAPDLEQVARRDTILAALVEEDHHLGRLEVLAAGAAENVACTPSVTGTAWASARRRELLGREHPLAIPDRPVRGDDLAT